MRGTPSDAAVSRPPAGAGSGGPDGSRRGSWRPPGWLAVVIPVLAELIVGGYRIGGPSLWRDEAATISGSQRPVSAIATMVRHEDAVHGPYYLLMHLVIAAGGISATVLRLPSLIAMCLAVGLTAALGRRLAQATGMAAPQAAGLLAGLALAAVPLTTRYAQEARPYALTTLFAVLATYLLVRAVASPRWLWWVLYAAALVLTGLFSLASMLLVGAHLVSLLTARGTPAADDPRAQRPPWRRVLAPWLAACAAAAVLLTPIAVLSAGQSAQLNWVRTPDLSTIATLVRDFAGSAVLIPVVALLAAAGCAEGTGLRRGGGLTLTAIALPWLVLPPALLLAVSLAHPLYVERYILFCLPALALLTAAGLVWLARMTRRGLSGRGLPARRADLLAAVAPAMVALVLAAALIGPQRAIRQGSARADNLRTVAAVIARHELRGDAILYLPRDTELISVAYPAPFRPLRDVGLGRSAIASGTLRGTQAAPGVITARLRQARRVWTVQWAVPLSRTTEAPAGETRLLAPLRMIGRWRVRSVILRLYLVGPHRA
jgi:mannosyltransferase